MNAIYLSPSKIGLSDVEPYLEMRVLKIFLIKTQSSKVNVRKIDLHEILLGFRHLEWVGCSRILMLVHEKGWRLMTQKVMAQFDNDRKDSINLPRFRSKVHHDAPSFGNPTKNFDTSISIYNFSKFGIAIAFAFILKQIRYLHLSFKIRAKKCCNQKFNSLMGFIAVAWYVVEGFRNIFPKK